MQCSNFSVSGKRVKKKSKWPVAKNNIKQSRCNKKRPQMLRVERRDDGARENFKRIAFALKQTVQRGTHVTKWMRDKLSTLQQYNTVGRPLDNL